MSFNKNYPNRKDWRKPYRKAKACDSSCRNHGGCGYCESNRFHSATVRETKAEEQLKEYFSGQFIKDQLIIEEKFKDDEDCYDEIDWEWFINKITPKYVSR